MHVSSLTVALSCTLCMSRLREWPHASYRNHILEHLKQSGAPEAEVNALQLKLIVRSGCVFLLLSCDAVRRAMSVAARVQEARILRLADQGIKHPASLLQERAAAQSPLPSTQEVSPANTAVTLRGLSMSVQQDAVPLDASGSSAVSAQLVSFAASRSDGFPESKQDAGIYRLCTILLSTLR